MPPKTVLIPLPAAAPGESPRRLLRLRPKLTPHFPAVVFTLTTLLLPIGAINGPNNLLFWMFGLAVAALLGSGIIGAWTIASIAVEREPVEPCHVGDLSRIRYRLINTSRWIPVFAVGILELERPPFALRRKRTSPTWHRKFTRGFAFAEYIPSGGSIGISAQVAATGRGIALFDAVEVWTTFPFGLSRKTVLHAREQAAIVRPRPVRIRPEQIALLSRGKDPRSSGAASRAGAGEEFHSLREHTEGDPPRVVAWKRSASAGRLLVRQHAQPPNRRIWIGLGDLTSLAPPIAEDALAAAAGLAVAAAAAGHAVGLLGSVARPAIPPRHGARPVAEVLDALALIDPSREAAASAPGLVGGSTRIVIIDPLGAASPIPTASVLRPDEICADVLPSRTPPEPWVTPRSWLPRAGAVLRSMLPGRSRSPAPEGRP